MAFQLTQQFASYAHWRQSVTQHIADYQTWITAHDLADSQVEQRINQLLSRLREDKLNIAFVAEFSRGKSELINAIFFADYGERLLPSSAGRTTMCPTELLYDASQPSSIRLLPIDTRLKDISVSDYKHDAAQWKTIPFDVRSNDSMSRAFKEVERTKHVSVEVATKLGLYHPDSEETGTVNKNARVEVPCWRYAVINFPHPLLEQGLVVLDTPGLNAIGTEPELTLNMLPNAHAVLFVLGADTGVTKSEMDVWQQYIAQASKSTRGRFAVLNKIDGLWDELKNDLEVQKELNQQVQTTAELLSIEKPSIFPVSAKKGLFAKINEDHDLLEKSRLPELERALSEELIPFKQDIVREHTETELNELMNGSLMTLAARIDNLNQQLNELRGLRGRNDDVVAQMMQKVKQDKQSFEKDLKHFMALRSVFSKQANRLFTLLSMDAVNKKVKDVRGRMVKANFTMSMRSAMDTFFMDLKQPLNSADKQVIEIMKMMDVMYQKFAKQHGLRRLKPPAFSMKRYQQELQQYEATYQQQFNTKVNMLTNEKMVLTNKFFATLASRMVEVFEIANRDVEDWLKSVIVPMESQIREHQGQLRHRLDSVKKVHQASDTLEARISELEAMEHAMQQQVKDLNALAAQIKQTLQLKQVDDYMHAA